MATKTVEKPKIAEESILTTEIVNQATGEIVTLDEALAGYEEDIGAGFEGQTSEDVGIPFLVLMQPLSPEVAAEGSNVKPGQWVNRGTGEVFADGAQFVPCTTQHHFIEWSSKDPSGSAPVASHPIDSEIVVRVRRDQPFGEYTHPDNPEHPLVETFTVFGLSITADGVGIPSVINFTSTHIRAYKDFVLKARSILMTLPNGRKINPPLFAHVYRLASKRVEKKPHVWHVPVISFADLGGAEKSRLLPTDMLYQQAKQLREAVNSGTAKAAAAQSRMEAGDAPLQRGSTDSEDAPY